MTRQRTGRRARKRGSGRTTSTNRPADAVRSSRQHRRWGWGCALLAFLVYLANGDILVGNDAKANVYMPLSLLTEGNLSFSPQEAPFMFIWRLKTPDGRARSYSFANVNQRVAGVPIKQLIERGQLSPAAPKYFITPSRYPNIYVNTFGPGAALAALPVIAPLHFLIGGLWERPDLLWHGAKVAAAAYVAGSALLLFFVAVRFVSLAGALLLTLTYAFGTCAWSISSQALWQHGPNMFFLMLGLYFLSRTSADRHAALFCGATLGMAVMCRPTSAVVVVAVGIYFAVVDRRAGLRYVLGGLPFAVFVLGYNAYYLGAPWDFGQTVQASRIAEVKTGVRQLWQTPLWKGAAGLLLSPSRGLLVHSPVIGFMAWGAIRVFRDERWNFLRPVVIATLLLWVIAFKWFDWWGGWTFGYRPIVDTMILSALCMLPIIDTVLQRVALRRVFVALLIWSVYVQMIGAFAYDVVSWNARPAVRVPGQPRPHLAADVREAQHIANSKGRGSQVVRLDIDQPANRYRLWSLTDNQIVFYTRHFAEARKRKRRSMRDWLTNPTL